MTRVLLIDDDIKFRQLVISALGGFKLDIVQATTLEEATMELQCNKFDLIILDGWLNDLSGESWLRSVRASGFQTDVVFVTGTWRDTESYYRLINELRVRLIVHKPISGLIFAEQIRQVISHLLRIDSNADHENDMATELHNLSLEFLQELPDRLEELGACLRECAKGLSAQPGSFTNALRLAHQLRGTGSSFGQEWVTNIAEEIEGRLKKIATSSQPMNIHAMTDMVDQVTHAVLRSRTLKPPSRTMTPSAGAVPLVTNQGTKVNKVLLVDDDLFFTRKVEYLLSAEGIIVTTFTDTIRLLDVLEEVRPDLLILDINLPGVSGFDICQRLRRQPQWKLLPILMVTADTPWSARNIAIQAGATDYLTKPVSNKDFIDRVHSLFSDDAYTEAEIPALPEAASQ